MNGHRLELKNLHFPRIGSLPVLVLALVIFAYLFYMFLTPRAPPKPDSTWTGIHTGGILRIGIDPSSPPFIVDDGKGNLSGFDIALAEEFAKRWGVTIQYVYTGYDGLYDALNAKQFDMILSALPYNPNKTQDVFFSHSYFNGGPVLIVRGDDKTTTELENLSGKAIAVELGSNGDTVGRKWEKRYNLSLRQFDTAAQALRALQTHQADAAIVDPISFIDFQRAESDTGALNWRVVGKPLADENYVVAVRRDSPTLLQEIDAVIDALWAENKMEELYKKNF